MIINEIDNLLVNDLRVVTNVEALSTYAFPSDHKIVKCQTLIRVTRKYRNFNATKKKAKMVAPVHKRAELNLNLSNKPQNPNFTAEKNVQTKYNILEQAINSSVNEVGLIR